MEFRRFVMAIALFVAGSANAATILAPTDGDVNFLNQSINLNASTWVAMFNVNDLGGTANAVVLSNGNISSLAVFTPNGPNTDVGVTLSPSNSTSSMTLIGSDNFILGLTIDGGVNWIGDSGYIDLGSNFTQILFDVNGQTLAVDVKVVPVPAAVWLLGSGLLGLVGVARRHSAV